METKIAIGIMAFCGIASFLGLIFWVGIVIYLKKKWMAQLEDTLDNGTRFYSSLGLFFAGQGVLQYATVFLWRFHAKRFGMLEKRDKVSKHIQRWFIFAFWEFMLSFALFVVAGILVQIYA